MLFRSLYRVTAPEDPPTVNYASIAMVKLTISKAHQKLSHIAPSAKAKVAWQPFPKESKTHVTKYGECIHWDLWEPASVQSLSGNSYMVACIDDATCETMLYFQVKKSQTIDSYKRNEALIKTQTGNCIKVACSDRGGEFLSNDLTQHQDMRGTKCELIVHDSLQQNSVHS